MKYYFIALAFICALFTSCSDSRQSKKENAESEKLAQRKKDIDYLITDSTLVIMVKVKGKKELVPVVDRRYPRNIEITYNLLKDKDGKIIFISEMPYNETSDWFIAYKSYFDENGNLFAFQRLNNFLNNECTHGAAMENSIGYYNKDFLLVDSLYSLTDTYKKPLDKKACKFPYNFKYTVIKNLKEYRAAKNIPLI